MNRFHLALTDAESILLSRLELSYDDPSIASDKRAKAFEANKRYVVLLMESLLDRDAIPSHRWAFWNSPDYQFDSRSKRSRREVFEGNHKADYHLYEHPHFLKYLRYFLFGPRVPVDLVNEFEDDCSERGLRFDSLTSGDIFPLREVSRQIVRKAVKNYGCLKNNITEELFKIYLELGIEASTAMFVYKQVNKLQLS
ncbi:MAG: hypothetical protein OXG88_03740 [Gammaproteobacteria bacterium]|nr:hypothetical protein [Gammaproteobacteria bacterium]